MYIILFIYFHPLLLLTLHSRQEKEVRKWKEELLEQRRRMMEEKLLHAELKRELQLQAIVKKAQEEEAKVEEGKCSNRMCVTDEEFSELSGTFAVVLFLLCCITFKYTY